MGSNPCGSQDEKQELMDPEVPALADELAREKMQAGGVEANTFLVKAF